MPDTPFTSAWPPSLPSVPTSRATRVTSAANAESWSTIVFTVVPMRRNSPFTGWPSMVSAILRSRSPSATASSTRATSVVGRTRSSISALSDSVLDSQPPPAAPMRGALVHAALAADHASHPGQLLLHAGVGGDELVVGGADLAHEATAAARQAAGEVPVASGDQSLEDLLQHCGVGGFRRLSGLGCGHHVPLGNPYSDAWGPVPSASVIARPCALSAGLANHRFGSCASGGRGLRESPRAPPA